MKTHFHKHELPCGATVVAEHMPSMYSAAIGFWVRFGSREEPHHLQGAAHYIEHMLFKGTAARSPRDIANDIESVGGGINASTGKESTCYYARVLTEHIPLAVEILADIFRNSLFPEEEFLREKDVILQEIKSRDDEPEDLVGELFFEDVFGPGALGHSTLGREETISGLTRDALHSAWRAAYTPPRLVVAAAGNLGRYRIDRLVQSALDGALSRARSARPRAKPCPYRPGIRLHARDIEQTHFVLGVPGAPHRHPDRFVFTLIEMLLSGGMSSRLFQEIREKRGLVYDIHSSDITFSDTGLLTIATAMQPDKLAEVLRLVVRELANFRGGDVRRDELERDKQMLRASIAMSLESGAARMRETARAELCFGRPVSDAELLNRIGRVSLADVRRVARSVFRPDRIALTVLGPFAPKECSALRRRFRRILET